MPPGLSRRQVRELDRVAIEVVGVPGAVLMENAGRNAADEIERFLAPTQGRAAGRIAVVAGAGNNGGDGFVIARHLAMRGWAVTTVLVAPAEKLSGDAAVNLNILRNLSAEVHDLAGRVGELAAMLADCDAIVDAVGGTGITGALRGDTAVAVEQINAAGKRVIAIDIPTGLDCDTGLAPGPAVRASLTITMLAGKKGFDNPMSRQYTGEVRLVDIGIPPDVVAIADRYGRARDD